MNRLFTWLGAIPFVLVWLFVILAMPVAVLLMLLVGPFLGRNEHET